MRRVGGVLRPSLWGPSPSEDPVAQPGPASPFLPCSGASQRSWRGLCRLKTRVNQLSSALTWHINHLPREEHPIAQRWVKTQRPRSRAGHLGRGGGADPGGLPLGPRTCRSPGRCHGCRRFPPWDGAASR